MVIKRESSKVCRCRSASPVRRVKPGLVEPQFPAVQAHTRRSKALATSPSYLCEIAAEGTLWVVSDHQ